MKWGALVGLLIAQVAWAGQGMELIGTTAPVDGAGRVQVVVSDISLRANIVGGDATFRAVPGTGSARVIRATKLTDTSEPAVTVLAFDASGSFRPYWSDALDLGDAFAAALPAAGNVVDVVTFGTRLDHHGTPSADPSEIRAALSDARATGSDQRATRLKGFVSDAIAAAAARQPATNGGARQVIVFTDGGDESDAYDVDALVREARDLGVRVHVVSLHAQSRTSPQRLDDIKRLAELTGGLYIQGDDGADAAARVATLARANQGTWWLDLAFCDVAAGAEHRTDTLTIEVVDDSQRVGFTEAVPFRQHASGAALEACTEVTTTPSEDVTTPTDTGDGWPTWAWAGLACAGLSLLGLLGLLALLLIRRARTKTEDEPVPELEPEAPEPLADAAPLPGPAAVWRDPFQTLPERHLRLLRGGKGLESFYRIHKSPFVVGGDAAMAPELLIAIPQVSGRHCTLQLYKNGALWVTDEHSTNGTFVDGRRLSPGERVQLLPGSRLGISRHVEFQVVDPTSSAPPPTPPEASPGPAAPPPAPEPAPEPAKRRQRTVYNPVKREDEE